MPIYMDRHDIPGATADKVAEAHQEDLKIQDKYGCRALTYWFDEGRGTAFCLIEAPGKDAVQTMHEHAHGLVANQIIEVDNSVVEAFLGRIQDPENAARSGDEEHLVINEPAFRTIMAAEVTNIALLISAVGVTGARKQLEFHNKLIRSLLEQYGGREVSFRGNGFLASFTAASQGVLCGIDIHQHFTQHAPASGTTLQVQIGLNAGVPVTENLGLFGQTVHVAKRLCEVASAEQVYISAEVRKLCKQEGLPDAGNAIKTFTLAEERFLHQLLDITEKVWNESDFTIRDLAKQLGQSKAQLYRNTVAVTGHSPNDFIKEFRLNKAAQLLEEQAGNVSEVAYQAGFSSPSYFSKCFRNRFSILPSEYATALTEPFSL